MDVGNNLLQPLKILGAGEFGRVILCKFHQRQYVCVKRIIVQNLKIDLRMIMEEVYIMSQICHPNIIQFIDSYVHASTVNIIMEYAPNGTLCDLIKQSSPNGFSSKNLLRYFCDILMGLEYLHMRRVLHRDLKPANLLVSETYCIKIADFGISLVYTSHKMDNWPFLGTPYYTAPEVLRGEKFDFKSDIWSLGCILYEMCCGSNPFIEAKNIKDLRRLIRSLTHQKFNCIIISNRYDSMWATLCESMLMFHLKERISLPGIIRTDAKLTMPFYQKYFEYLY